MKVTRFFMVATMVFATLFTVKADNNKPISFEKLPEASKAFIRKYFSENNISYAKVENDFFSKSYEVFFVDGSKVEFDKGGEWEEISFLNSPVPKGIIPAPIVSYIEKNHSNFYIIKIERDRRDYEVKLNNKLEIKFDLKFNVIEYDN